MALCGASEPTSADEQLRRAAGGPTRPLACLASLRGLRCHPFPPLLLAPRRSALRLPTMTPFATLPRQVLRDRRKRDLTRERDRSGRDQSGRDQSDRARPKNDLQLRVCRRRAPRRLHRARNAAKLFAYDPEAHTEAALLSVGRMGDYECTWCGVRLSVASQVRCSSEGGEAGSGGPAWDALGRWPLKHDGGKGGAGPSTRATATTAGKCARKPTAGRCR
jgi:hypothetical protein